MIRGGIAIEGFPAESTFGRYGRGLWSLADAETVPQNGPNPQQRVGAECYPEAAYYIIL